MLRARFCLHGSALGQSDTRRTRIWANRPARVIGRGKQDGAYLIMQSDAASGVVLFAVDHAAMDHIPGTVLPFESDGPGVTLARAMLSQIPQEEYLRMLEAVAAGEVVPVSNDRLRHLYEAICRTTLPSCYRDEDGDERVRGPAGVLAGVPYPIGYPVIWQKLELTRLQCDPVLGTAALCDALHRPLFSMVRAVGRRTWLDYTARTQLSPAVSVRVKVSPQSLTAADPIVPAGKPVSVQPDSQPLAPLSISSIPGSGESSPEQADSKLTDATVAMAWLSAAQANSLFAEPDTKLLRQYLVDNNIPLPLPAVVVQKRGALRRIAKAVEPAAGGGPDTNAKVKRLRRRLEYLHAKASDTLR
jgi:hypothetical protein